MSEYDLDLDALQPEIRKVKLNGQIVDVYPPRFKSVITLMKLANKEADGADLERQAEEIKSALMPIMPALQKDDMDITFEQLMKLLQFAIDISTPKDQEKLESMGYSVKQVAQKKTE